MFDFSHSFSIFPFLGLFVTTEGGLETHGAVAWCVWVKNPYVNKCMLASIPKASHSDVESCAVFSVGCVMVENFT